MFQGRVFCRVVKGLGFIQVDDDVLSRGRFQVFGSYLCFQLSLDNLVRF